MQILSIYETILSVQFLITAVLRIPLNCDITLLSAVIFVVIFNSSETVLKSTTIVKWSWPDDYTDWSNLLVARVIYIYVRAHYVD